MSNNLFNLEFYKGKRVLLTGHTGFKGTWMTKVLLKSGSKVLGYSNGIPTEPNLFSIANLEPFIKTKTDLSSFKIDSTDLDEPYLIDVRGDICDLKKLKKCFDLFKPQIVIHMAAQPLVRESYVNPVLTYQTNVMGTVNVLECVHHTDSVKSVLNVTTDKVYKNNEFVWGYREDEYLDGFDPYSNSKSCSELVTHCYKNSFLSNIAVSTARSGNVIGGGDFSKDRIIPDCVRAMEHHVPIKVRNKNSIRPYQHVLEPVMTYLMVAQKQFENSEFQGYYNVGPDDCDCVTTGQLVSLFCKHWSDNATWLDCSEENAPHEANFLKLDCSYLKSKFNWKPRWHIDECMKLTCELSKCILNHKGNDTSVSDLMNSQIDLYLN